MTSKAERKRRKKTLLTSLNIATKVQMAMPVTQKLIAGRPILVAAMRAVKKHDHRGLSQWLQRWTSDIVNPAVLSLHERGILSSAVLWFERDWDAPGQPHVPPARWEPETMASISTHDLPTVAESLPGFEAIAWNGLLAPAGTPPAVIAKLSAELRTAMAAPEVRERFEAQGFAAAWATPDAFADFIGAEVAKWAKVVQVSGATIE